MTVYSKFCIICNKQYLTIRLGTLYCSKKCGNRARALPVGLKEQLLARNNKFNLSMLNHMDRDGLVTQRQVIEYDPANRLVNKTISKADQTMLWERAAQMARDRGIDPNAKKHEVRVDKSLVDPKMHEFKLDEDNTGFGSRVLDDEMKAQIYELKENEIPVLSDKKEEQRELSQQQTQPQQPIGLRKFGSLGGNKNGDNNGPKK